MVKGILFDKDDTLIDLAAFWCKPVKMLAKFLSSSNSENQSLLYQLEAAAGFDNGKLLSESPVVAGTNNDILEACENVLCKNGIQVKDNFKEEGIKYLVNACIIYGEVKPKANFAKILPYLKENGIKIGVATSDDYGPTIHCLKELHIEQYFDSILSADCGLAAKPAPDMAQMFCRQHRIHPSEVLMIGDSVNDMMFAANSGLVGVWFAPEQDSAFLPIGASYLLKDPLELDYIIAAQNNNIKMMATK